MLTCESPLLSALALGVTSCLGNPSAAHFFECERQCVGSCHPMGTNTPLEGLAPPARRGNGSVDCSVRGLHRTVETLLRAGCCKAEKVALIMSDAEPPTRSSSP